MMSEDSPKSILVVNCACGLLMRGTVDELVPTVQKHALEAHNMRVTRQDVLAKARPES